MVNLHARRRGGHSKYTVLHIIFYSFIIASMEKFYINNDACIISKQSTVIHLELNKTMFMELFEKCKPLINHISQNPNKPNDVNNYVQINNNHKSFSIIILCI